MDPGELLEISKEYHKQLTTEGRQWLNARGLSDVTIDRNLLGQVTTAAIVSHTKYTGSLSIPYLLPLGRGAATIRFRYLKGSARKYDNLKGDKLHLYNVGNSAEPDVSLCEGEFDSLILGQEGFPAVGVPGAGSFRPEWKYLFLGNDRLSLVFDGDDAGQRGAARIASYLGTVRSGAIRLVRLPPGLDCTDLYLQDPQALRELLQ